MMEIQNSASFMPIKGKAITPAQFEEKARGVAKDFEALYLYQVLELMEPPVSENKIFGGGFAEEQFRQTLNEETAKTIANSNNSVGIADHIYSELMRFQEGQQ